MKYGIPTDAASAQSRIRLDPFCAMRTLQKVAVALTTAASDYNPIDSTFRTKRVDGGNAKMAGNSPGAITTCGYTIARLDTDVILQQFE
jgi:hypothetical protein